MCGKILPCVIECTVQLCFGTTENGIPNAFDGGCVVHSMMHDGSCIVLLMVVKGGSLMLFSDGIICRIL